MAFVTGYQAVGITFLALEMDHWCEIPALQNLTAKQQQYIARPWDDKKGTTP